MLRVYCPLPPALGLAHPLRRHAATICSLLGVEVGGTHLAVMGWGMVLAEVVAQVATTGGPINVELSLVFPILKPIEIHVY